MRFLEYVSAQDVKLKFAYHDELNPKLWDGDKLKPEVAKHLLELSELFEEFLKLPDLKVVDRIFTGSNANYNWTSLSDIDLHLVIDISELKEFDADLIAEYLTAKKKRKSTIVVIRTPASACTPTGNPGAWRSISL